MRVAAARHHETLYVRAFADDELAIRRKRGPAFANEIFRNPFRGGKQPSETLFKTVQHSPIRLDRSSRGSPRRLYRLKSASPSGGTHFRRLSRRDPESSNRLRDTKARL